MILCVFDPRWALTYGCKPSSKSTCQLVQTAPAGVLIGGFAGAQALAEVNMIDVGALLLKRVLKNEWKELVHEDVGPILIKVLPRDPGSTYWACLFCVSYVLIWSSG